ncbi:MAG: efflux transporter outer membrane subunit [Burkholderiales bacterium]|nr:efflux transporter outer membrane subunit [Burkholderiales bacterium]
MTRSVHAATLLLALAVGGCASLAPPVPEAVPAIPTQWPLPATTVEANAPADAGQVAAPGITAADIGWREFFADPALDTLIAQALEHNRDLRIAVLNIERARVQYRIQRADQIPSIGISGIASQGGGPGNLAPDAYSVRLGLTDFELDFFGRVRDLSRVALQRYFAQSETRRVAQLALIAEVANAYLTLAGDQALLQVAQATLTNQSDAFRLTQRRHELGAVSGLDLEQARTTVETARADAARFAGQVAQDINALNLLVGGPVDMDLLPTGFNGGIIGITALPAGLPSEVLLRRPDVLAAEHRLRAANANIGAARAAFFPSIRLTAAVGLASDALTRLASGGAGFSTLQPQINLPIFDSGRLQGDLDVAKADQDIALAEYEKAIQTGFREVADALALTRTLSAQREAQLTLLAAATRANDLSLARYQAGRDSYLVQLVTQRTLYAAQQALVSTRAAEQTNRVTLYKVLGGGWYERSQ